MLDRHGEWVEGATLADFAERDRRIVKVGRKHLLRMATQSLAFVEAEG